MKPYLLLDVDGVLCPFGCVEPPPGYGRVATIPWVWFSRENGRILKELEKTYDPVWATMWEHSANEELVPLLDGAGPYPVIEFRESLRELRVEKDAWADYLGHSTYKLKAIEQFVGDRPFLWIDDHIFEDAFYWAENRDAPTMLIRTEPEEGLTKEVWERVQAWPKSSQFTDFLG